MNIHVKKKIGHSVTDGAMTMCGGPEWIFPRSEGTERDLGLKAADGSPPQVDEVLPEVSSL
jgi:hypothetical protein